MTGALGAEERRADTFWAPLEATPAAIIVTDDEGKVVLANEDAARMFGRSTAEFTGIPAETLFETRCRASWTARLSRVFRACAADDFASDDALFGLREDSQEFAVELSLRLLTVAGAPRAIGVFRDITERRHTVQQHAAVAAEAQAARSWLEALLEFAPAIIIAVNPSGTIEYINKVLPQYTKEQVLGSFWLKYFPPDMHARMKADLATVLASGTPQVYEAVTTGPDGNNMWFLSQLGPIWDHGRVVGGIVVAQDITERKRTEIELLAARRMAVLGTLAAGVAHEINTPIQFVGDSLRFLRESGLELLGLIERLQTLRRTLLGGRPLADAFAEAEEAEEQADLPYIRAQMPAAFDRCIDGLNRVTAIVRSLKEFAHPADQEMSSVDLNHAIQSTLTIATNEYRYVANLETDFADLPNIVCHVGEISQVVLNIVVNAAHAIGDVVKGSDRKGLIRVQTRREADTVVIAISDTGGGIPESIRSRIFDPFFTTKDIGKGTGQGLAISWSSVKDKHGGEITFDTKVGEGTTFFIRLPISGKVKSKKGEAHAARTD